MKTLLLGVGEVRCLEQAQRQDGRLSTRERGLEGVGDASSSARQGGRLPAFREKT